VCFAAIPGKASPGAARKPFKRFVFVLLPWVLQLQEESRSREKDSREEVRAGAVQPFDEKIENQRFHQTLDAGAMSAPRRAPSRLVPTLNIKPQKDKWARPPLSARSYMSTVTTARSAAGLSARSAGTAFNAEVWRRQQEGHFDHHRAMADLRTGNEYIVVDPFVTRVPKLGFSLLNYLILISLPFLGFVLMFLTFGFDAMFDSRYSVTDMMYQLANPDVDPAASKKIFHPILMLVSLVFGMLLTIIGLSVELSASRFTGKVASLFGSNWFVISSAGFIVVGTVFTFWVFQSIGGPDRYLPRTSVWVVTISTIYMLVLMFPLMGYLFLFLDPQRVIPMIVHHGRDAVAACTIAAPEDTIRHQLKLFACIEHLSDACLQGTKARDKVIAAKTVDALCSLLIEYGRQKDLLHQEREAWFQIPIWIREQPEFRPVADEKIMKITDEHTWVEYAILRRLQGLFLESLSNLKDTAYYIAMNSFIIGEAAGSERGDFPTLDLVLIFFNTFVRAALNASQVYVIYILLYQYQRLATNLIEAGHLRKEWAIRREFEFELEIRPHAYTGVTEDQLLQQLSEEMDDNGEYCWGIELHYRAVRIAKFMRFYASQALFKGIGFILLTVGHDIRAMCETAFLCKDTVHEQLFDIFVSLNSHFNNNPMLRSSQACLASFYLLHGDTEHADAVFGCMANESFPVLAGTFRDITNVTDKDFFEVTDRPKNFMYLERDQIRSLKRLFAKFPQWDHKTIDLKKYTKKPKESSQAGAGGNQNRS
jgi:hypothetical protein